MSNNGYMNRHLKGLSSYINRLENKKELLQDKIYKQEDEIETLKEMKLHTEKYASEMEDKYILEKNKNDKAIEYIEQHNDYFLLKREVKELLSILKGVDKDVSVKEL